ncbi:MAG: SMP-30/gluconolactonase/LRE family protein [Stappiaceae bacterium]
MTRVAVPCANDLGESPVWCWRTGRLYWTNIRAKTIHVLSPDTGETWTIDAPEFVAAIGLHKDGGLITGMLSTIARCAPDSGEFETLAEVEPTSLGNRGNDGRVDRDGRFWFGTMSNTQRTPEGALYLYDGTVLEKIRSDIIVPNALCWSPGATTMYFADSWVGEIEIWSRARASDPYVVSGMLLQKGQLPGIPDGAIVDSEGFLWNARYGGGCVARINPNGDVVQTIELPTRQVTSCALGGEDLKTLYVTSATQRMSEEQRQAEPDAGALFAIDVDVPGLPEPEFLPER